MANPTTNFGWQMPTSTDLVTDLPADFEVFGQAVDTSLMDLKGGTTGQVLTKASNTDMDFTWAADASGIPATIFDAKGDLIAASAADTAARLAVGTNGQVLTADSTTGTGLKWATPASGSMTSIASGSLSGSAVTIMSSIPGTYRNLRLVLSNHYLSADGQTQITVNNTTGIYCIDTSNNIGTAGTGGGQMTQTYLVTNTQANSDNRAANQLAIIDIFEYAATTHKLGTFRSNEGNTTSSSDFNTVQGQFGIRLTSAITRVDVSTSTGTFSAGTYVLYGVN